MIVALARRTFAFARFAAAGAVSMGVILTVLASLQRAGVPASGAYAASLTVAFGLNFAINRSLVFGAQGRAPVHGQALAYLLASLAFRGGEWASFALVRAATHMPAAALAMLVQGGSMIAKYFVFKHVVFRARG